MKPQPSGQVIRNILQSGKIMFKKPGHILKSIIILNLIIALFSCKNDLARVNEISYVDSLPIQSARDIEVIYSDSGIIQAKLTSPEMDKYVRDEGYIEFPKGINVTFYDSGLVVKSTLRANYAIRWEERKIMEARNNVVIVNYKKDEKINTEDIIWDEKKHRIYSDVFVKRTSKEDTLYGDGFDADETFSKYKLRNPRGTIMVDKNK